MPRTGFEVRKLLETEGYAMLTDDGWIPCSYEEVLQYELGPSESYRRQVNRDKAWTQKQIETIWGNLDADKITDN